MKKIIAAILSVASTASSASGIESDKLIHFAGIAAVSGITYMVTGDALTAFVVGVGVGVGKEIYDANRKGGTGFSGADIVADVLGAAAGVGVCVAVSFSF